MINELEKYAKDLAETCEENEGLKREVTSLKREIDSLKEEIASLKDDIRFIKEENDPPSLFSSRNFFTGKPSITIEGDVK